MPRSFLIRKILGLDEDKSDHDVGKSSRVENENQGHAVYKSEGQLY